MTLSLALRAVRKKAVWGPRRLAAALTIVTLALGATTAAAGQRPNPSERARKYRLDHEVERLKGSQPLEVSSVIVTLQPGATLPPEFAPFVRRFNRLASLDVINGVVLELPNYMIRQLEARPEVFRVHHNRPISSSNLRTSVTVGALATRSLLGYTGAGIGIAVIDSGVATWHDDLAGQSGPYGNQRVTMFVDFVGGQTTPYDDNGHGTHVSGIIAGNGYDSFGEKAGIAPNASIISLKVLDAEGRGTIGGMIAAINWIATNHKTYNIRVVNISVGALALESYWTDPLTLAAKALVDRGIVVVSAAGNFGKNPNGELQYGGITAPANAPWVLTVGASTTRGTFTRSDDEVAGFSSSGPTAVDFLAKPDLVAPGTGTVSLAAPGSAFYSAKSDYLVSGYRALSYKPYLTLSGTSMAAPVVSGTVALMLQANPSLTPNLVKGILQYTAQEDPDYNALQQGAGFLNSYGAVRLSKFYADNRVGSQMPVQSTWSKQIIWGNYRITGGYLNPKGNAWANDVVWGATQAANWGDNIIWGTQCGFCDNIIWGTFWNGDNIIWGTNWFDNIIWGTDCGGADCSGKVWGSWGFDNIIWGTAQWFDNIIWGTNFLDNIIWGTSFLDNIIWGTSGGDGETWATNGSEQTVFSEEGREPLPDVGQEFGETAAPRPEGGL